MKADFNTGFGSLYNAKPQINYQTYNTNKRNVTFQSAPTIMRAEKTAANTAGEKGILSSVAVILAAVAGMFGIKKQGAELNNDLNTGETGHENTEVNENMLHDIEMLQKSGISASAKDGILTFNYEDIDFRIKDMSNKDTSLHKYVIEFTGGFMIPDNISVEVVNKSYAIGKPYMNSMKDTRPSKYIWLMTPQWLYNNGYRHYLKKHAPEEYKKLRQR